MVTISFLLGRWGLLGDFAWAERAVAFGRVVEIITPKAYRKPFNLKRSLGWYFRIDLR